MITRGCPPVSLPGAALSLGGGAAVPAAFHWNGGLRHPAQVRAVADGPVRAAGRRLPHQAATRPLFLALLAVAVRHG